MTLEQLESMGPSAGLLTLFDGNGATTHTFNLKVGDDGTSGQLFKDPNLSGYYGGDICFDIYHDDPNVEKYWCNDIDFIDMGSP